MDEIEDFNNVLDAFEKRDVDQVVKALENHIDRFVKKIKDRIL
jgi:DNA-binding GntR family transcriptional regulator